jgi:hypothetical protein
MSLDIPKRIARCKGNVNLKFDIAKIVGRIKASLKNHYMSKLHKNSNILTQGAEPKRMFKGLGKKHCLKPEQINEYVSNPDNYDSLHKKDTATVFLFELGGVVFAYIVHPLPDNGKELHHHVRELDDTDAAHAHRHHTLITPVKP